MEHPETSPAERFDAFRFHDSSELLQAYVDHRRDTSRYFSISSWAKKLGLPTSGILVNFLKRRRLPPEDLADRLSQSMQFTAEESEYFATLIALERAQKSKSITVGPLERKLAALNFRARSQTLDSEQLEKLSLRKAALKDMMKLPGASVDPAWIQKNSRLPMNVAEIDETVQSLIAEGSLEKTAEGWRPPPIPVETTTDLPSAAIRSFHRESLEYASQALDTVAVEERHFASYVMTVNAARMAEAKLAIQQFVDEFAARFEAPPGECDALYQLNLSYVPLTETPSGKTSS